MTRTTILAVTSHRPTIKARPRRATPTMPITLHTPAHPGLPATLLSSKASRCLPLPVGCPTGTAPRRHPPTTTLPHTPDPTNLPTPEGPERACTNPTVRQMRTTGASLWGKGTEGRWDWEQGSTSAFAGMGHTLPHRKAATRASSKFDTKAISEVITKAVTKARRFPKSACSREAPSSVLGGSKGENQGMILSFLFFVFSLFSNVPLQIFRTALKLNVRTRDV